MKVLKQINISRTVLLSFLGFYLLIISSTVYSNQINPDYKNITFEHLSIEDGLSQITVHSILQDSKGFLWFGTEDGLNRYDGYNFIIYKNDPSNQNSISDNFIWKIFEDSDSNLWIGTNSGGLNKFDYELNEFVHFRVEAQKENSISENNIRSILEYENGKLLIGTNSEGLDIFDVEAKTFNNYKFNLTENSDYNSNAIRALCKDEEGIIWIGTEGGGLIEFNAKLNSVVIHKHDPLNNESLSSNTIWSLECGNDNIIWVGTYSGGLNKYNKTTKKFIRFNSEGEDGNIANVNITDLDVDKNKLLISTEGGLSILDLQTKKIINYQHNISDFGSISNNFIRTCFIDRTNLIWLGTVGGGVNKANTSKKFNHYNHNPSDPNSLNHNMIRAISEDSFGNLWIGTLGKGLNKFDRSTNRFEHFESLTNNENSLSDNIITSIWEDTKKQLWVGTWGGGLNRINFSKGMSNGKIESVSHFVHNAQDSNSIISSIIQAVFEDSKHNIWIGTEDGLDLYDESSSKFYHFTHNHQDSSSISDNRIQSKCILEDRSGNLWIGTWKGLNKIQLMHDKQNPESKHIKSVRFLYNPLDSNSLSDNRVISLYEDQSHSLPDKMILWVGTIGGGLNKVEIVPNNNGEDSYKFMRFTEKDGLASNVVYGILGDNEGNLWLSTNNGISKFNLSEEVFRNYDTRDGLQSNQFFWGAAHKSKSGELFFGGINGLNSFFPNKLVDNKNIPPVLITNCTISPLDSPNDNNVTKINTIGDLKKIRIPYNKYRIDFEFTALDFTMSKKNQYSYFLENYDQSWSEKQNSNIATYTNIAEGDFTFQVVGSNNDGTWNKTGASFRIIIETPFWKTWWFIVLVMIFFALIIAYFIVTQVKNMLAVERLRTKLAADLHDNIGSSLTEISILSEVINTRLKTSDDDVQKNLNKISSKSRYLIDKMSDIVWLVNPQRDSLYDLILRLQDTYSELLAETSISFRSENLRTLEKISLSMEHRQHLFLVFKEAINNAIKYSNCSEIILNAVVEGKKLEMILSDNGVGFEQEGLIKGNGLSNMTERAKKIGGKLIIHSEIGKGTLVRYIGTILK